MTTYVALLRAVNVGGRNRVAMSWLRDALADLGHRDVRTLLQSGNAVFATSRSDAPGMASEIRQRIADDLGLEIAVVLRTAAELRAVVDGNPFVQAAADPRNLHVTFLEKAVPADAYAAIDPSHYAPDEFHARPREVYVWYRNGLASSKLTYTLWQSKLGVVATARGWNTVTKLADMVQA